MIKKESISLIKESSKENLYQDMSRYRDYKTGESVLFYRLTNKEFQKEVLDAVREFYENMTEPKADVVIRLQEVLAIQ